ncbi:MAG: glycoside hydrolase N-terminal domain-containing protein [Bacteroidales bacterium]|nr:glycoside hydrolase N-terminal domain-containing protein [Bacteroidales bacterium]
MKIVKEISGIFLAILTGLSGMAQDMDPSVTLWYDKPAKVWEEALPVGNGRLGAMVFGKYGEEKIQINEDTYWSGGPYSSVVKDGYKVLPAIQKHLFNGEPLEAHKLFGRYIMGYPVEQQKYQSLANLHIFSERDTIVDQYKRMLDLSKGIVNVEYQANGIKYKREVFSSVPHQVLVVRLSADKPGSISFRAQLRGCRNMAHSNYGTDYFRMDSSDDDRLILRGKSADYLGIEGKMLYRAELKAVSEGGTVRTDGIDLYVENADAVTLYIVAATNFVNYKDVSADQDKRVANYLANIEALSYTQIKEAAIKDYKSLFNRVSLNLPITENSYLPTDERMKSLEQNDDPNLASLCYNFGRYILISSSRPGTQPANLQGIWNKDQNPSWDSKYTTNINTEMNYWPVESANLSECAEPLIKMVEELSDQGSEVAQEHYGASGWVFHQNTDLWRVAAPMDGPTWGTFTTGGAWLTTHLYEHYLYTGDKEYLEKVYPVIKGSVDFFMDFLIEHPSGKWLVTSPSNSPENPPKGEGYRYFYDEVTGMYYFTTICYGSSIDMQIINDLFKYYIASSIILKTDRAYAQKVEEARLRLVPPMIGSDGRLQEWTEDYKQLEDKHRHFSHMYGLYPGNVISSRRTPQLIEACKAVLEQRGDGGTGFSRGWKMALWARMYDGNRAEKIFKGYIKEQAYPQLFAKCNTPLQIDGTMGVTAGITEMLMHSHEDYIDLLPALPDSWSSGSFSGVCARGGFELDFSWKDGKVSSLNIISKVGGELKLKAGKIKAIKSGARIKKFKVSEDSIISLSTLAGKVYTIRY